ncbi:MAG: hypothetical protein H7Y07_13765 [Pyrinomonadaceae bacterium]|nr:hypothetical protein [Sphingobacteriaceae bacterium]
MTQSSPFKTRDGRYMRLYRPQSLLLLTNKKLVFFYGTKSALQMLFSGILVTNEDDKRNSKAALKESKIRSSPILTKSLKTAICNSNRGNVGDKLLVCATLLPIAFCNNLVKVFA